MDKTLLADPELDVTRIWKDNHPTPLIELPKLAGLAGVGQVFIKVEGERPLRNFKVLGGMVAGLRVLARAVGVNSMAELDFARSKGPLPPLVCASYGNHGLAVAAAARRAGARAVIFLPRGASQARVARIEEQGAEIAWVAGTYDAAVRTAAAHAARGHGLLVADTGSDPDDQVVGDVIAGYGLIAREILAQFRNRMRDRPSHLFVQAGVGGLAAAMADGLADFMQGPKRLLVVEPKTAACVAHGLARGRPVLFPGNLRTSAEMLACGVASARALQVLLRHGAQSIVVDEDRLHDAVEVLREVGGIFSTTSGAAGVAGLLHAAADPVLRVAQGLSEESSVLLIATEGALGAARAGTTASH